MRIFICPFMITSNTILATILIMSGEEGVDLKLFVKVVNEQFQSLNLILDSLLRSRSRRQSTSEEEEEEEYLDARSHGRQRCEPRRNNHLGSFKMTIPMFQGKNYLKLYLEWERKVEHVFDCHNYSEEQKG